MKIVELIKKFEAAREATAGPLYCEAVRLEYVAAKEAVTKHVEALHEELLRESRKEDQPFLETPMTELTYFNTWVWLDMAQRKGWR